MFIRVEDQSGNLTIWLNVNQIAKLEDSKAGGEQELRGDNGIQCNYCG